MRIERQDLPLIAGFQRGKRIEGGLLRLSEMVGVTHAEGVVNGDYQDLAPARGAARASHKRVCKRQRHEDQQRDAQ